MPTMRLFVLLLMAIFRFYASSTREEGLVVFVQAQEVKQSTTPTTSELTTADVEEEESSLSNNFSPPGFDQLVPTLAKLLAEKPGDYRNVDLQTVFDGLRINASLITSEFDKKNLTSLQQTQLRYVAGYLQGHSDTDIALQHAFADIVALFHLNSTRIGKEDALRALSDSVSFEVAINYFHAAVCSSEVVRRMHFCDPDLITSVGGALWDIEHCASMPHPACGHGFFKLILTRGDLYHDTMRCCPGYFCPPNLVCMVPCSQGAFCPSPAVVNAGSMLDPFAALSHADTASTTKETNNNTTSVVHADDGNKSVLGGEESDSDLPDTIWQLLEADAEDDDDSNVLQRPSKMLADVKALLKKRQKVQRPECKPFGYYGDIRFGCGGAPTDFPCPAGYYCPDPTKIVRCPQGFKCPQGSVEPKKCLAFSVCPPGSEYPAQAFQPVLIVLGLTFLFCLARVVYHHRFHLTPNCCRANKKTNRSDSSQQGKDPKHTASFSDAQKREHFLLSTSASVYMRSTVDYPIAIELQQVGLTLKKKPDAPPILCDVSCSFLPGRVVALMGPSGAGKTSLLSVVNGTASSYGVVSGKVLVNGQEKPIAAFKDVCGFVPQIDTMYTDLTVYENLMFSARMRLPKALSEEAVEELVREVIATLKLQAQTNSVVGNASKRGISGGQLKRVNIGLELVANPTLLFLDEPTSGLDATTSSQIMDALNEYKKHQTTVVVVIHQPRPEIFYSFDDVCFLGRGGRLVFFGSPVLASAYFAQLGYEMPQAMNPADYYMDILEGQVRFDARKTVVSDDGSLWRSIDELTQQPCHLQHQPSVGNGGEVGAMDGGKAVVEGEGEKGDKAKGVSGRSRLVSVPDKRPEVSVVEAAAALQRLFNCWESHGRSFTSKSKSKVWGEGGHRGSNLPPMQVAPELKSVYLVRVRRAMLEQMSMCASRALLQQWRNVTLIATDILLVCSTAFLVGFMFKNGSFASAPGVAFLISLCSSTTAVMQALRTFGPIRLEFLRESAAGLNAVSFFLGKNFVQLANTILMPFLWATLYWSVAWPAASLPQYWLILLANQFAWSGLGQVISLLMSPEKAQLGGVVFTLAIHLISGSNPTLRELNNMGILFVSTPSPARWGLEAIVVAEWNAWSGVFDRMKVGALERLGYEVHLNRNLEYMCLIGLCFYLVALLCLISRGRKA